METQKNLEEYAQFLLLQGANIWSSVDSLLSDQSPQNIINHTGNFANIGLQITQMIVNAVGDAKAKELLQKYETLNELYKVKQQEIAQKVLSNKLEDLPI